MIPGLQIIERKIKENIENELNNVGFLYRIFSRIKNIESIKEKKIRKEKEGNGYKIGDKLMQDVIGIRVVTYFQDDIDLIIEILRTKLNYLSEEIDDHKLTVFKPKRTNIICEFSDEQKETFLSIQRTHQEFDIIDTTFEIQLRTILSEGWHEIDHTLRYKSKSDWSEHKESERLLNGIYASLEANDIALKNLFNELSYKHFKNHNWEGLLRTKFRLHFKIKPLNNKIIRILNNNNGLAKELMRLDRHDTLLTLYKANLSFPNTMDNLLYLINILILRDKNLFTITPDIIIEAARNNVYKSLGEW